MEFWLASPGKQILPHWMTTKMVKTLIKLLESLMTSSRNSHFFSILALDEEELNHLMNYIGTTESRMEK